METYLVVAASDNGVIGIENKIPWRLPRDMEYFKQRTSYADENKTPVVIMGRKTFDSIPKKFKPLPGRHNIVITRNKDIEKTSGVTYVNSLEQAMSEARKITSHTYIIGGAEIYKQALESNIVDAIFITRVLVTVDGDAFFAPIDETKFKNTLYREYASDAENKHAMRFETWVIL